MNKNIIIHHYGTDWKKMAKEICEAAGLCEMIGDSRRKIGLKPNLVNTTTADNGATTHPEVAEGVIEYLKDKGYQDISIIEGSWTGGNTTRAFAVCGYEELHRNYGVELMDTQKDRAKEYDCKGVPILICNSALEVDFMINLPVMKGHCQTTITCALKNNKGVIPDSEKRRFHTMGLHKPIAHLNTVAKNDFIIVDAICGDLDFEEGGNPVPMNRMMGFADPVLCDAYVCSLLGYSVEEVPYIGMAQALGVGNADITKAEIVELAEGSNTGQPVRFTRRVGKLAQKVDARDACSACYGSLIHALDRLERKGVRIEKTICIGQGFRHFAGQEDKKSSSLGKLGIGSCTAGFEKCLKGCPPDTVDIMEFISSVKIR